MTRNRVTRSALADTIRLALDENATDLWRVDEDVDGVRTLTIVDDLDAPPEVVGAYHGGVLRDLALPPFEDFDDAEIAERKIKKADLERALTFCISDNSVDRYGDIVQPAGMDKKNFRVNPVVLFAHEYWNLAVGRSVREWSDKADHGGDDVTRKVCAIAVFATMDHNPMAEFVFNSYKGGFLNAVSIGFIPKEIKVRRSEDDADGNGGGKFLGYEYKKWELLEYSAVPVPANANAIVEARSAGIDVGAWGEWASRYLDDCDDDAIVVRSFGSRRLVETAWTNAFARTAALVNGTKDGSADADPPTDPPETDLPLVLEGTPIEDTIGNAAAFVVNEDSRVGFVRTEDGHVVRIDVSTIKDLDATIVPGVRLALGDDVYELVEDGDVRKWVLIDDTPADGSEGGDEVDRNATRAFLTVAAAFVDQRDLTDAERETVAAALRDLKIVRSPGDYVQTDDFRALTERVDALEEQFATFDVSTTDGDANDGNADGEVSTTDPPADPERTADPPASLDEIDVATLDAESADAAIRGLVKLTT